VFEALAAATRDFFRPRMLGLVLWPLFGSLLLWAVLGFFFWHPLVAGLQNLASVPALQNLLGEHVLHWFSEFSVSIALLLLVPPLVQATALLITATIAMPVMLKDVAARDYPQLERRRGGSFAGGIWNALASTLLYLLLWLLTLPLWFFGIPALVLPVVLGGWLNERLFRYDALAEHASADEFALLRRRDGGQLFLLGCVGALIQLVPLVNLIAPVYSGLSFVHFGLAGLSRLRAARTAVSV
jgi:CysZ protein